MKNVLKFRILSMKEVYTEAKKINIMHFLIANFMGEIGNLYKIVFISIKFI